MQSVSEYFKILPVLVCRKRQAKENFMNKKIKQLNKNLKLNVKILKEIIINEERDVPVLDGHVAKADVVLLYKPHLGLGNCIVKIFEYDIPIIIFNAEGKTNNPLDALEYVYPKEEVWVAVDYQDINHYLRALSTKKKMRQTKKY